MRRLKLIQSVFLEPLQSSSIVSAEDMKLVFSGVPSLVLYHEELKNRLTQHIYAKRFKDHAGAVHFDYGDYDIGDAFCVRNRLALRLAPIERRRTPSHAQAVLVCVDVRSCQAKADTATARFRPSQSAAVSEHSSHLAD